MTAPQEQVFNPEVQLMREVQEVITPLSEVVDLDMYAKTLHEAAQAEDPADRVVRLSDFARADGFFEESGGSVRHTPLSRMPDLPGYEHAFVKRDHLQPIGAYKIRGGQLRVNSALRENPAITDFTTGSAGNAALAMGLAVANHNRAAMARGDLILDGQGTAAKGTLIKAHVFGRRDMSPVKLDQLRALERYGVVLHTDYDDLDKAIEDAEWAAQTDFGRQRDNETPSNTCFVAPFDHHDVMAGQGTLLLETLADLVAQGVDLQADRLRILVPVGGRGLLAGTLAVLEWVKHKGLVADDAEVIGVQLDQCDAAARDFYGEAPLSPETLNQHCDGTAVLRCGSKADSLVKQYAAGFMRLSEGQLGRGMDYLRWTFHDHAEPAGALAPSGLLLLAESCPSPETAGRREVLVSFLTGQNATPETRRYFHDRYMAPYIAASAARSAAHLDRKVHGLSEVMQRRRPDLGSLICAGTVVAAGPQFR